MLVRPITTKPAARSRATTGASASAGAESSSAREPARVTCPLMSKRSLIETGMPANGDGAACALRSRSIASAAAIAASLSTWMKVRAPSPAGSAILARHSSTSLRAEVRRYRDRRQVRQVSDVSAWLSRPLPLASLVVRSEPECREATRQFAVRGLSPDDTLAYKRSRPRQECSYAKPIAGPLTGDSQMSHQDRNTTGLTA